MINKRISHLISLYFFQTLDGAMKQFKTLLPNIAVMLFSTDEDNGKILCMAAVPKVREM